jgi:lysophospholipase L1-like esterase
VLLRTDGVPEVAWAVAPRRADTSEFTVRAVGDGPVDLLGWSADRNAPGVTYSNFGTIGASITLLDRWDDAVLRRELAHLSPAMIVVAFGTNEGFRDATDPEAYAATFARRLRALRAVAPGAALLAIGPPDGARHAAGAGDCGDGRWSTPPRLASVRAAQRRAAEEEGAFFWDWQAAMGGACSMVEWASVSPPFAAPDHVHLLAPGYRRSADGLFDTIMEGYARYRALRGAPVS